MSKCNNYKIAINMSVSVSQPQELMPPILAVMNVDL